MNMTAEIRCRFTVQVDGATCCCKGDMGHKGRCWVKPPGAMERITWVPSISDHRKLLNSVRRRLRETVKVTE